MSRLAGASPPAACLRGLDAITSSAVMWGRQPLRLVATPHHRFTAFDALQCQPVGKAGYRHAHAPPSYRVVFVAVVVHARCVTHFVALRVYIGCCFGKWPAVVALKLRLVPATAAGPCGFPKQALCKVACAGQRARQPSALPGRWRALRAAAWSPWCWCCGLGVWSGASRYVLASGLRPVVWCQPPPTRWASPLRGIGPCAQPARLPPKGAPSVRARRAWVIGLPAGASRPKHE